MIRPLSKPTRNLLLIGGLLYLAAPFLQTHGTRAQMQNPAEIESQRQARNTSAFAVMLGEFRASLSDLIFIKTERYLDRGVGYEPHTDTRAMATADDDHDHGHSHDHDHDHDHDHGEEAKTLIRSAHDDFRGFIGNLERQVKPWRPADAPHDHASDTEMSEVLPWYRLATLSNPHDVRNYYIGAWWLKTLRTEAQRQQAISFLDEGIAANPTAYELYLMRGMVLRDLERPVDARDSFRKSAEIGLKRRPPGGYKADEENPAWDQTNEEQLDMAIGMDVMMTRDLETTASAQAVLDQYKKALPGEPTLKRMEDTLAGN